MHLNKVLTCINLRAQQCNASPVRRAELPSATRQKRRHGVTSVNGEHSAGPQRRRPHRYRSIRTEGHQRLRDGQPDGYVVAYMLQFYFNAENET